MKVTSDYNKRSRPRKRAGCSTGAGALLQSGGLRRPQFRASIRRMIAVPQRELGYLYSGDIAPVHGVYKGLHRCGRMCCWAVWQAGKPLPFCVDCGFIRFYLMCVAPSAEAEFATEVAAGDDDSGGALVEVGAPR